MLIWQNSFCLFISDLTMFLTIFKMFDTTYERQNYSFISSVVCKPIKITFRLSFTPSRPIFGYGSALKLFAFDMKSRKPYLVGERRWRIKITGRCGQNNTFVLNLKFPQQMLQSQVVLHLNKHNFKFIPLNDRLRVSPNNLQLRVLLRVL